MPEKPNLNPRQQLLENALKAVGDAMGIKLEATPEDKLRFAMMEAAEWLRMHSPGRALEVLENCLEDTQLR